MEFKGATLSWKSSDLNDTDRLNGILVRGDMYLVYDHFRSYDLQKGEWTQWSAGNRPKNIGGALLAPVLVPGTSQWSVRATKISDGWTLNPKVPYAEDIEQVRSAMIQASVVNKK